MASHPKELTPTTDRIAAPAIRAARRQIFTVEGMCCGSEVRQLEAKLRPLPGVATLAFDVVAHKLVVVGAVSAATIQRAVRDIGMTARTEAQIAAPLPFWERRGRIVTTTVSGTLLAAGLAVQWGAGQSLAAIVLLVLSAIAGGWLIAPRAWRAARGGVCDMNVLMTIATAGAFGIGEWSEGASVMFLFSVAQLLEAHSMDRARNAIKGLMDLSPTEASVRRHGRESVVPVADVVIGDIVVVRPGQKIHWTAWSLPGRPVSIKPRLRVNPCRSTKCQARRSSPGRSTRTACSISG